MTSDSPIELTVLFADICRSTTLFDKLGDQPALDLIMAAIQLASQIVKQNHGTIIGTIGDEVMCTFVSPEDALISASQIHTEVQTNAAMRVHQLAMRVGINSGSVVNSSNSVYGDAVNIAARLSQQAKANQSLISSATVESIRDNLRNQLRLVGQVSLPGKAGTIEVYETLESGLEEEITEVATNNDIVSRSFLMTARYRSRHMRFDPMLVRFVFGRHLDCDQVIDHPTISRQHAEFLYRDGQFIFRDFSTNGSVIVQGPKTERLHRTSFELRGSGKLYLGRTLGDHLYCIDFTCITTR